MTSTRRLRSRCRRPRRGSIYVLVLISSMVVALIGLSSMTVGRLRVQAAGSSDDRALAQYVAMAGLDYGLFLVDNAIEVERGGGAAWRNQFVSGSVSPKFPFADGSFTWTVEDATGDGDIGDDKNEPIRVVSVGTVNGAVYRLGVELEPGYGKAGIDSLESAIHTGGQMDYDGCTVTSDNWISANGDVAAGGGAQIHPDVEAVGPIAGGSYYGTKTTSAPAREMPGASALAYYLSRGTPIDVNDLPGASPKRLRRVVLSPANNPYGAANAEGIYVLDCEGNTLSISHCRIVGTLVLLNPGSATRVRRQVNWEPAYPNYPALLVDGDMRFNFENTALREADAGNSGEKMNFNPPGTPYRQQTDGVQEADADQQFAAEFGDTYDPAVHNDTYPSVIAGLVYVTGDVEILSGAPSFEGVLLIGNKLTMDPGTTLDVLYRDTFVTDAPMGFRRRGVGFPVLVAGSLRQIVH